MPLLRLLIAFALALALPLQGLAAMTCMCKLHHAQQQGALSRSANAGEAPHAQLRDQASAAEFAASDDTLKFAKKHGACPKCAMTCCHASAPAPASRSETQAAPPVGPVSWTHRLLASWAEPVPDKPPRA